MELKVKMLSRLIVLLAIASMSLGCGGSGANGPDLPADASELITEVRDAILEASYGGASLKKKSDVAQIESQFPKAAAAIKNGEVELIWGKTIRDGANASPQIIAYEKTAETGEGWAVKDNGSIAKVTAAEIAELQK